MLPSRDIERLIEIMRALRTPATGCAWDLEQDFGSIAPYTIEEAYEVADAINRNDLDDLCEELGDLLLQVVFHARIAEERGSFAFGDVVEAITTKMIRRHPHVFGPEARASNGIMAKGQWERIKAEEKAERSQRRIASGKSAEDQSSGLLDSIPVAFPALTRALKLQEKAARVGFDWNEAPPILEKIDEEIGELREVLATESPDRIEDEFGDLLFSLVNLGRHLRIDPEAALKRTNEKFRIRFGYVQRSVERAGSKLQDTSLPEMEKLWQKAKTEI